ncbi:invasion associated locus B family protein [Azospirillum sp. B510]|uniref:invasion associated locus B family protein n=1 Tax=Azospirillum sp. (strain B510) TaxID=137722 RepID=UPI0005AB3DDA|nr:invasion associated locus B family protein [Azospirillum sp. B510]
MRAMGLLGGFKAVIATGLLAVTLAGSPVTAKPAVALDVAKAAADFGPEGAWTNQCDIDRMTDSKTCRLMIYRLFDDGKDVGFIALSIIPTGNDFHLFLTTSQGLLDRCAIRVDRQPRIESHVATLNMCMFPNFVSGRVADQFRNGTTILVRITTRQGKRDIDFPLNGFSRTFEEMQRGLQ